MAVKVKEFKHLLNSTIAALLEVREHGETFAKPLRLAKNAAYLAAQHYHALREAYPNDFIDFCNGDITAWVNKEFAVIRHYLMDDPWTLIKAVGDGMTRAEYLSEAPGVLTGGRCHAKKSNRSTVQDLPELASAIPATMDLEQQLAHVSRLYDVARTENIRLKQRVAQLERALRKLT